jgi:DASH complex subunit DAM1
MTSRTPLRRVSQGSLFALSQHNPDAPHGLGFIEPVMSELVDEAEALHANVDSLRRLSNSLRSFNESFAGWLYVMDMNALTTDWLQVRASRQIPDDRWICVQAPTDVSFQLAKNRAGTSRVCSEARPDAACRG